MANPTIPDSRPARPPPARLDWGVPLALVLLGVIPAIGGSLRLASYLPGATLLADDARFTGHRVLLVVHILGALGFALGGAFQFSRVLRGRRRELHRWLGRFASFGGLCGGLAGMAGVFTFAPHPEGSPALSVIRLLAGSAMIACLVIGWRTALRRDFVTHGRWMTRAYGLGSAAGTQALILGPLTAIQGPSSVGFAIGLTLGFVVNICVVERLLRRGQNRRSSERGAVAEGSGAAVSG